MYLVMTKEKPNPLIELAIRKLLPETIAMEQAYPYATKQTYDGHSTKTIQAHLEKENNNTVVVTADSRFFYFVGKMFAMENVFVYRVIENEPKLIPLQDATERILRKGHNLMKLYEAGEFEVGVGKGEETV